MVQAMGGEDLVSEPRMVLIHDLARAGLLLRAVMMRIAQSPDLDLDAVSKASNLINTRRSLLQVLGLDRVERDVPDLESYIADREDRASSVNTRTGGREVETVDGTNRASFHEHP